MKMYRLKDKKFYKNNLLIYIYFFIFLDGELYVGRNVVGLFNLFSVYVVFMVRIINLDSFFRLKYCKYLIIVFFFILSIFKLIFFCSLFVKKGRKFILFYIVI